MSKWSPDQVMAGAGKTNFGAASGLNKATLAQKVSPSPAANQAKATGSLAGTSISPGNISVSPGFGTSGGYAPNNSGEKAKATNIAAQTLGLDSVAPEPVVEVPPAPKFQPMTSDQRKAFSEAKPAIRADIGTVLPVEKGAPPSSWTDSPSNIGTAPNVRMSAAAQATPPALNKLASKEGGLVVKHDRYASGMVLPEVIKQTGTTEGSRTGAPNLREGLRDIRGGAWDPNSEGGVLPTTDPWEPKVKPGSIDKLEMPKVYIEHKVGGKYDGKVDTGGNPITVNREVQAGKPGGITHDVTADMTGHVNQQWEIGYTEELKVPRENLKK